MNQNANNNHAGKNSIFSILLDNRVIISKGDSAVLNLPILIGILSLVIFPKLTIISTVVALVLGCRFSMEKSATDCGGAFEAGVKSAAEKVKSAAEHVRKEIIDGIEKWDGVEDHH